MNSSTAQVSSRPTTTRETAVHPAGSDAASSVPAGPTPDRIMQLGLGFWGSKTLLTAIELELFTVLGRGGRDADGLGAALQLNPRGTRDFLDALVALGMLERRDGLYENTPETDTFLNKARPTYAGGMLEMANARLYPFWGSLTEALRTGLPQNETKHGGDVFGEIYADPARLRQFLSAMTGISLASARSIAEKFPWHEYHSFLDVGCAQGALPVQVALAHAHLTGGGFDLAPVKPVFQEYVAGFELSDRLSFHAGDFLNGQLPTADVLVMGHVLHDWNLEIKRMLLGKAYEALPAGGALIVYGGLIDDERRSNAFGLLMSLNMLIETPGGFDYSGADCRRWMHETGFRKTRVESLVGAASMVVGIK